MSDGWRWVYDGYDPDAERLREALCALGNGAFVTRGAGEESSDDAIHYPGTYIAGGYNRLETEIAGRRIVNEDLVNFPNWLVLSLRPEDGDWLDLGAVAVLSYRQELDLKGGVLHRAFTIRDGDGRETRISTRRFVHMACPHLAGISMEIVPVNWAGTLDVRSGIDGSVRNNGVARYRDLRGDHVVIEETGDQNGIIWLTATTRQSAFQVAYAARTHLEGAPTSEIRTERDPTGIQRRLSIRVEPGCAVAVEKTVGVRASRDPAVGDLLTEAIAAARDAPAIDALLEEHRRAWARLWDRFDVEIDVEPSAELPGYTIQQIVRLHIFHLLQTASFHTADRDVGLPARGLHGEAYRGHIFWDEAYIIPWFTHRAPEISRALLRYRHRRIEVARANADAEGFSGAMYPWQSGSSGREETQVLHLNPRSGQWDADRSHLQRHVNAAIAWNVWRYVEATDDRSFLREYGAEILLEIARFWASAARWNSDRGCYEIVNVMGPDEFHEAYPDAEQGGLRNNAYTNAMAVWCLERGLELIDRKLADDERNEWTARLDISDDEIGRWRDVSSRMWLPVMENGVIEQFEGYEDLKEFDWASYQAKYERIGRLDRILRAEGDSPDRYRVSKQADVCMLLYLLERDELAALLRRLGYDLDDAVLRQTVEFYRARTSHGSTLSHLVFAAVLEEIDRPAAWEHFVEALRSDVDDVQDGTTPEGIHAAVMAGTIRHIVEHFAGARVTSDGLVLRPRLPDGVRRIRSSLLVRGSRVTIEIDRDSASVGVAGNAPMAIDVATATARRTVNPGETSRFAVRSV